MTDAEHIQFDDLLAKDAAERRHQLNEADQKYVDTDEYEKLHLYGAHSHATEQPAKGTAASEPRPEEQSGAATRKK
jgi:hypothetical protein